MDEIEFLKLPRLVGNCSFSASFLHLLSTKSLANNNGGLILARLCVCNVLH